MFHPIERTPNHMDIFSRIPVHDAPIPPREYTQILTDLTHNPTLENWMALFAQIQSLFRGYHTTVNLGLAAVPNRSIYLKTTLNPQPTGYAPEAKLYLYPEPYAAVRNEKGWLVNQPPIPYPDFDVCWNPFNPAQPPLDKHTVAQEPSPAGSAPSPGLPVWLL